MLCRRSAKMKKTNGKCGSRWEEAAGTTLQNQMNTSKEKFYPIPDSNTFFLADIKYWAEHEQELREWCQNNRCELKGMVVVAETDYAYTMFVLRWS